MAVNKRLIFWLIKAYIKRWRKTILIFFIIGLGFFFLLRFFFSTIIAKFPLIQKEYIGVVGTYTVNTLPPFVLQEVSHGLTRLDSHGIPQPDIASSWEIKDDGKSTNKRIYVFHIKPHLTFTDGTPVTSKEITVSYSDVKVERPNATTIIFTLKEPYAPFLVRMSRPIFKDGFVGINGDFQIKDIKFNGDFITSLTVTGTKEAFRVKVYSFYPTQEALKLAFILGSVTKAEGLTNLTFRGTNMKSYPNETISKATDYNQLVTVFYNTQDKTLSDKKLRDALSYAIPNSFTEGERASSPLSPKSWAYQADFLRTQDFEHANLLMKTIQDPNLPTFTISTLGRYKTVAEELQKVWQKIGIKTKVKVVSGTPDNYQIFVGSFNVPEDPDQYSLWHSNQPNNITNFNSSLRIDKLLEDGRKFTEQDKRLKTYADFQKYLLDEQPASFLYFPYVYTITRK